MGGDVSASSRAREQTIAVARGKGSVCMASQSHKVALWLAIGMVAFSTNASADALVFTRAMKATTIAEIFITQDSVVVELEIGGADLKGFRNLLPDKIYERLGYAPRPIALRLPQFLEKEFKVIANGDHPLRAHVRQIAVRYRIERDVITGEPLPAGEDPTPVVFVVLSYALPPGTRTLTLGAPVDPETGTISASIGFVAYHQGLPINDFRYLGESETLDLDWQDPWYSQFRNRNLRRKFDAPLSAYLYVENFEVRKEIVARPKDLQQWVDLGIAGKDTLYASDQAELKQRAAEFLQDRNPVTIDGRQVEGKLDRIYFVRRTLRRTGVIDPPEDLPTISATLGIIYVYPIDSLPNRVTMSWELFSDRINRVPSSVTDEAGGLPYILQRDDSVLVWQNFLTNPTVPTLATIAVPNEGSISLVSLIGAILLMGLLVVSIRRAQLRSRPVLITASVLVIVTVASWSVARVPLVLPGLGGVADEQIEAVVGGLLTNVYRSFDYRDESDIYDALSQSASGALLTDIYLETRQALELQNQGGARVKIKTVTLDSVVVETVDGNKQFEVLCRWTVSGSVGHWGHLHTRENQYEARLTIDNIEGKWKITALELLQELRVSRAVNNVTDRNIAYQW